MANSKLKRLYYRQGGRCFYCDQSLRLTDASLDHVIPKAHGGTDDMENLVCCCKAINQLFADVSAKSKLQTLIQWKGALPCPMAQSA